MGYVSVKKTFVLNAALGAAGDARVESLPHDDEWSIKHGESVIIRDSDGDRVALTADEAVTLCAALSEWLVAIGAVEGS